MAHDVFISYSSVDADVAQAVLEALETRSIQCWIAPRDALPGRQYAASILNAIKGSQVMVLILSPHSNTSQHVLNEVERAVSMGMPILPFRIQDVSLSDAMEYYISSSHWFEAASPPKAEHLTKLADTVEVLLGRDKGEPEGEAAEPGVRKEKPVPVSKDMGAVDDRTGKVKKYASFAILSLLLVVVAVVIFYRTSSNSNDIPVKTTVNSDPSETSFEDPPKTEPQDSIPGLSGMKFVSIPAGTFTMGSPPDEPGRQEGETPHRVTLTRPFHIQTTEVTVGQWRQFVDETGFKTEAEKVGYSLGWTGTEWGKLPGVYWDSPGFDQGDDNPVTCVSWNDVQVFIDWLGKKTGKQYRLPYEAEWEYACRAGSKEALSNGPLTETECKMDPGLDKVAWYCYTSYDRSHPVAQKAPNAWGLYDMHGNVYEWCRDCKEPYSSEPVTDPFGPVNCNHRNVRGGAWDDHGQKCRAANRTEEHVDANANNLGFRLVLVD